jgi:alginate O-acetyltransferase complex protein AlgI
MAFTSVPYLLFLLLLYPIYHFTAERWRWLVLLAGSYGFYAFLKAPYLLAVLLGITGVSYLCGIRLALEQDESRRRCWFWGGSAGCLAVLAFFKYFPLVAPQGSAPLVSIGVSYFTFQAISYLADLFLEIDEPELHLGHFALYMAFFPKLLQGPIERGGALLPQLKRPYLFDYDRMRSGLLLFCWGLFKKVALADRFAIYADQVYGNVHGYSGLALLAGTYAYAFQIYFDFSGYTDMARGAGRIFGIELTENFRSPYLATSVADFWRRWHISFSRWILDYIFKPLQMGWRDWGQGGTAAALLVTFLVSGLWHGATWGFVIWGLLHGSYLAAATYYRPYQKRLHKRLGIERSRWLKCWQVLFVFNLINVAWVFFRAATLPDALFVLERLFWSVSGAGLSELLSQQGKSNLLALIMSSALFLLVSINRARLERGVAGKGLCRWGAYCSLIVYIVIFAVRKKSTFIYFGF